MTSEKKGKFIAGAVCPQCQALDRLVLKVSKNQSSTESSADGSESYTRTCVSCGFSETLTGSPAFSLPNTLKDRTQTQDNQSQTVKILNPR